VRKFGEALINRKQQLAESMTYSMGKTLVINTSEVDGAVACINIYCDGAEKWLANEPVEGV